MSVDALEQLVKTMVQRDLTSASGLYDEIKRGGGVKLGDAFK